MLEREREGERSEQGLRETRESTTDCVVKEGERQRATESDRK